MSKVLVVYYSSTGNTQQMADAVVEGAKGKGAEVDCFNVSDFDQSTINNYDAYAFGCSAMGAEVLEEAEFDPMFTAIEPLLVGKKVGLFGSYGWGDGEWMRNWVDRCKADGIDLVNDGVIANAEPDDLAKAECKQLGEALA